MKLNRRFKKIIFAATAVGGVSLLTIPAITLTSCSSAANSYYPFTNLVINGNTLGLNSANWKINNANSSIDWNGAFYGFQNVNQVTTMYEQVMAENGLNVYQPSSAALNKLNEVYQDNGGWYKKTGFNPLPTNFNLVNRLPLVTLNALNLYQHAQTTALNYAKILTKGLMNLSSPNFDKNNSFSLTNLLSSSQFDAKQLKQLIAGLTVGFGEAANSFLLGISNLDLDIKSSSSFDPNIDLNSLTTPGQQIGQTGDFLKAIPASEIKEQDGPAFIVDSDKLYNQRVVYLTITPKVSYSWYKQQTTGGKTLDTNSDVNETFNKFKTSANEAIYKDLGSLNATYTLDLEPITIALQREVLWTNLPATNINGTWQPYFGAGANDKTNGAKVITTGAVVPLKFSVGDPKKPIEVAFAFGDLTKNASAPNESFNPSLLTYAINATSTQLFMNTINSAKLNGNDNVLLWAQNLYKLPFFAYDEYKKLVTNPANNIWKENQILSSEQFQKVFGSSSSDLTNENTVLGQYNLAINPKKGNPQWFDLTKPSANNVATLIKKLSVSGSVN